MGDRPEIMLFDGIILVHDRTEGINESYLGEDNGYHNEMGGERNPDSDIYRTIRMRVLVMEEAMGIYLGRWKRAARLAEAIKHPEINPVRRHICNKHLWRGKKK